MVEFFNRIVMLVTSSILAEESVYRRAKAVQKAIKVTKIKKVFLVYFKRDPF